MASSGPDHLLICACPARPVGPEDRTGIAPADGTGQIFADPPAMRGTSGQVYTNNIVILQVKNLDNLCSPARSCPRPPRLAWLAGELAMAGGSVSRIRINFSRPTILNKLIYHIF